MTGQGQLPFPAAPAAGACPRCPHPLEEHASKPAAAARGFACLRTGRGRGCHSWSSPAAVLLVCRTCDERWREFAPCSMVALLGELVEEP